jgi:lysophospholipase L1-like esterase
VYLCRPTPVVGAGIPGIRADVVTGEVIPLIDQAASELNLEVIDLHHALEGRPDTLLDGVHPNDEGAGLIAKAVYRALLWKGPAR